MICQITYRAAARVKRHGLLVYPLEGFGLLLGETAADGDTCVQAALPVGKTLRWGDADGRYADTERALAVATQTFASWGLRPVGFYCSVGDSCDGGQAPRYDEVPWLLLYPLHGHESIWGFHMYRWNGEAWMDHAYQQIAPRRESALRNPNRMNTAWNRAWGVLDYDNGYVPEAEQQQQTSP